MLFDCPSEKILSSISIKEVIIVVMLGLPSWVLKIFWGMTPDIEDRSYELELEWLILAVLHCLFLPESVSNTRLFLPWLRFIFPTLMITPSLGVSAVGITTWLFVWYIRSEWVELVLLPPFCLNDVIACWMSRELFIGTVFIRVFSFFGFFFLVLG